MFFLCNTIGHIEKFKTLGELKEYIEIRYVEEDDLIGFQKLRISMESNMAVIGVLKSSRLDRG